MFTVALQFFEVLGAAAPMLAAVPVIFILSITAIKDAVEDLRRHQADATLNKSITWTLSNWRNDNYPSRRERWWSFLFCGLVKNNDSNCRKIKNYNVCHCIKPTENPKQGICMECGLFSRKKRFQLKKTRSLDSTQEYNKTTKVNMSGWMQTLWKDVKVGDFILLRKDDNIPADLVILSTSEAGGLCYVETKNLDGETNLKARECLKDTIDIQSAQDCRTVKLKISSDKPDANLYAHHGSFQLVNEGDTVDGLATPFSINNMLLRGSVLRNTEYVIGLVIFTGKDTKMLMNSGNTPSKQSKLEILMNPLVIQSIVQVFMIDNDQFCYSVYFVFVEWSG